MKELHFALTCEAFADGDRIPRRFAGDGENVSPPFMWATPPPRTKSFVLLCEDPDAPGGVWRHWALFDIPADRNELGEHVPRSYPHQAQNDFRRTGYDGPCPPRGHGTHRYVFRLIAVSVEHLPLERNPTCADVARIAQNHALAAAEVTGLYSR